MLVVLILIVLGLAPVFFVQNNLAYVAGWSSFLVMSLTVMLTTRARLLGRITRRASRVINYVVVVLATAALGAALRLLRS